MPVRLMVIFW